MNFGCLINQTKIVKIEFSKRVAYNLELCATRSEDIIVLAAYTFKWFQMVGHGIKLISSRNEY